MMALVQRIFVRFQANRSMNNYKLRVQHLTDLAYNLDSDR
jgi:hypothetical protein